MSFEYKPSGGIVRALGTVILDFSKELVFATVAVLIPMLTYRCKALLSTHPWQHFVPAFSLIIVILVVVR